MIESCPPALRISQKRFDSFPNVKSQLVMVWGGISANSRTNLIFVPSGVKINSKTYRDLILETEVKSAGHKLFRNSNWIFQQDGVLAHTANVTQQWFRDKKIEFISKEEWPPSSSISILWTIRSGLFWRKRHVLSPT